MMELVREFPKMKYEVDYMFINSKMYNKIIIEEYTTNKKKNKCKCITISYTIFRLSNRQGSNTVLLSFMLVVNPITQFNDNYFSDCN